MDNEVIDSATNKEKNSKTRLAERTIFPEEQNTLSLEDKISLRRRVTARFRGGSTPYLSKLIKTSPAIQKQFVPTYHEGFEFGTEAPFEEGRENHGIYGLERIYADRALLTPYFDCAAYCRYCFKKTRTLAGDGRTMTDGNIAQAMTYISNDARIDTALLTGGDPLARPDLLVKMLSELDRIPHIRKIRIGTRHILFRPDSITDQLAEQIAQYNRVDPDNPYASQNVSIGVSLNHADELTPEVIRAVRRLTSKGLAVRGQMVLLKGINDNLETLKVLIDRFLLAGIIPYYLLHCMDVVGTYHMRTSVQKGLDILEQLAPFSGTYNPTYVYVTPIGKHRLSPGYTFDYQAIEDKTYIRARSPYKAKDFLEFSGKQQLPRLHDVDSDGYIISHYLDGNDAEVAT